MNDRELSVEIGKRIYQRRKQLNMTQERLSELTAATPQAISNYERGERELKASSIVKMAQALDTTADYLLTGRENAFFVSNDISEISSRDRELIFEIVERCLKLMKK